MIDALGDPLMHMIRNAIDHGIEPAPERTKKGKTATGQLHVGAQRIGTQLVIELRDDGRGLDPAKLMRTAVERGVLSPSVTLCDRDAFALIMRPGFSTAQVVSDLSGRGVGMDVVRDAVDKLGGTIDIDSRLGEGTTFTIRLPFRTHQARGAQQLWGHDDSPRTIGLIA
jgi:two-component system chemotaxis sensor kinase CheA